MPFEELPHTADVLIRVRAASLNELFRDSAAALVSVMYGSCRDAGRRKSFSLRADSTDDLLQEFLSEILFLSETEYLVFCDVKADVRETTLTATLSGEEFDPSRHSGGTEVKGISYSGLAIRREGEDYVVEILFDV